MGHKYWPFVNCFLNLIVSGTTMAAYYMYPHMAKLLPISNSVARRKKFSGIIAIDFSSSCHLDMSDNQKPFYESMQTRLQVVEFKNHIVLGVDFVEARYKVAQNALKHILRWRVCLPTTCCYEYVDLLPKIEVYQFFMCPSLGTTYRIQNY